MIWFSFLLLSSPASSMAFALADASAWNTLPPDIFMANSLSFLNSLSQSQPANEIYWDTLCDKTSCPLSSQSSWSNCYFPQTVPNVSHTSLWLPSTACLLFRSREKTSVTSPGSCLFCWLVHSTCLEQCMANTGHSRNIWWMNERMLNFNLVWSSWYTCHVCSVFIGSSWLIMAFKSFMSFNYFCLFDIVSERGVLKSATLIVDILFLCVILTAFVL